MAELIEVGDLAHGYRSILRSLLSDGDEVAPRGEKTYELRNVTIVQHNPHDVVPVGIGRRFSTTVACVEALQLVGGFSDPDLMIAVAPQYDAFADADEHGVRHFHGAYGARTCYKMQFVAERLRNDCDTRRACMTFWEDDRDLANEGLHDFPCTVYANLAVRRKKLLMTTHMRSNDAWLGYPYDQLQFTTLQRAMARFLGLEPGPYTHIVNSFHVYERDLDKVNALLDAEGNEDNERPGLVGGIGFPGLDHWAAVQRRATSLCYSPTFMLEHDGGVLSPEERWIAETMRKWWAKR